MLIITADDFGFSSACNTAILSAALRGRISAASLMVNMPYAEDACKQTHSQLPKLGLGLHFTLTSGGCVAPAEKIPLLVDGLGMFRLGFLALRRQLGTAETAKNEELLRQIRLEFEAQLRVLDQWQQRYALRIDHLDSHQHVHALRPIWNLLDEEARRRNLVLRVPREARGGFFRSPVGFMKKSLLDRCTRGVEQRVGYFGVVDSGKMGPGAWRRILAYLAEHRDRPYEVNVHPGLAGEKDAGGEAMLCSPADRVFHGSPWRQRELDTLLEPAFRDRLKELGLFPLATFRDVPDLPEPSESVESFTENP